MDFSPFVVPSSWGNDFAKIRKSIRNQANTALVPSCALAAIVARETQGRNIFQDGMAHDDPDCGYGYCQITYGADRSDPEAPTFEFGGRVFKLFDPSSNLYIAAAGFLAPAISDMLNLRESLGMQKMPAEILFYAFCAYNAGSYRVAQVVRGGGNADSITTNAYGSGTLDLYHAALAAS